MVNSENVSPSQVQKAKTRGKLQNETQDHFMGQEEADDEVDVETEEVKDHTEEAGDDSDTLNPVEGMMPLVVLGE